jgi:hypothetical protein
MLGADIGEVVVDDSRGGDAEIRLGAVIGLRRRRGDRLDVDPQRSMSASRFSTELNWIRLRSACSRLIRLVCSLAN